MGVERMVGGEHLGDDQCADAPDQCIGGFAFPDRRWAARRWRSRLQRRLGLRACRGRIRGPLWIPKRRRQSQLLVTARDRDPGAVADNHGFGSARSPQPDMGGAAGHAPKDGARLGLPEAPPPPVAPRRPRTVPRSAAGNARQPAPFHRTHARLPLRCTPLLRRRARRLRWPATIPRWRAGLPRRARNSEPATARKHRCRCKSAVRTTGKTAIWGSILTDYWHRLHP